MGVQPSINAEETNALAEHIEGLRAVIKPSAYLDFQPVRDPNSDSVFTLSSRYSNLSSRLSHGHFKQYVSLPQHGNETATFMWFAQLVHTKTGWTAVPNSVGRRMCELMATAKKSKLPHILTGAHITQGGVPLPSSTVQHRIPIRWPCRRRLGPPPA
jgi:hypothetical protein